MTLERDDLDAQLAALQECSDGRGETQPKQSDQTEMDTAAVDDGSDLRIVLAEIKSFIVRFVALSNDAAVYLALWVVHTHAIDAADHTPFPIIRSPQKRAGKSRLTEVLRCLVARPWMTSRTTVAALIRKIAKDRCTLLLDETDAAFAGEQEYSQSLRAILDAAHTRGALATLCVGQGAKIEACDFEVFTAVAIAGIGRLPDTIEDRGSRIVMKRRRKGEKIERFRARKVKADADALRARIARTAEVHLEALRASEPALPDELNDRAQDGWEPLMAVADKAGGDWPRIAREAAKALSGDRATEEDDDQNPSGWLLRDIRRAFNATPCDAEGLVFWEPPWAAVKRLHTTDLINRLCRIPGSPWATWRRGNPINPERLATLLDGYTDANGKQIRSKQMKLKISGKNVNRHGYERDDFEDPFARFLPPDSEQPATIATSDISEGFPRNSQPATENTVAGLENVNSVDRVTKVTGVAGLMPEKQPHSESADASAAPAMVPEIGDFADDLFSYAGQRIRAKASVGESDEVNDEW
jgi:hypothetical protein